MSGLHRDLPSLRDTAQPRKITAGGVSGGRGLKTSTKHNGRQHTGNSSFVESTPNMGKTTNGVPALSSLEYDVVSTPNKRARKRKNMMEEEEERSIEGGAGKRTSLSLEKSCVRRTLVVLPSHLEAESEKPEESGDQQESGSGVSAPSTHITETTNGVRRSVRKKKFLYDSLEEKKLLFEPDDAANMNVNPKIVVKKPSADESDSEEESDQEQMELSAYERERLENIKQNAKFLNSIKLLESVASLRPPKKKNQKHVVKRSSRRCPANPENDQTFFFYIYLFIFIFSRVLFYFREKGNTVVRRSMRLQNGTPSEVKLEEESPAVEENVRHMKPPGPIEMIPLNKQDDDKAMDQFMRMWTSISQETIKTPTNKTVKDLKSYEKSLKKMKLRAGDVAKVVPGRILSVAIHPSERRTLVAAGDKYGNVGLWNVDDNSDGKEIYVFELHSRNVGCLSFCPWNPACLLSLSYDGTVRCGDVTRTVFDEIYRDEEESFSSFGFYSADGSVLIVSHWDSTLSLMDRRTPGTTYEVRSPVDLSSPRTVSVHPLQRELCVVAGAGDVCIYDIRQISSKKLRPVISLPGHSKSVSSAYFSPVTGNRVLTTCADDRLRVFDSSSPTSTAPLLTSIRHNNFTGRWLSRFQALWDPKQEDCFMVGSMSRPRQIEVYHEDGNLVDNFWDENLNSVCSINVMHPTRSILVGGNSSGRLHVFRDQFA
ncbi:WD repeat-containing protein 76 [Rana temporaria]|uniref:WD repeat-containing protein 76 n=1 Tax=Rana temporaria TaxID=8407 RepID=UPI001AAC96A4|nr:WD repeat-containing protein 76 [Rana temporaria]